MNERQMALLNKNETAVKNEEMNGRRKERSTNRRLDTGQERKEFFTFLSSGLSLIAITIAFVFFFFVERGCLIIFKTFSVTATCLQLAEKVEEGREGKGKRRVSQVLRRGNVNAVKSWQL